MEQKTSEEIPMVFNGLDDQLQLAHKVVGVVDQTNKKTGVTLPRYNMDERESSYAQIRIFARKKEDDNFQ